MTLPSRPLSPRLRRRTFLSALSAGGAALCGSLVALGHRSRLARAAVYGELVPDPAGILDLPPGFSYRILEEFGAPMDDGYTVPANPDGMATFAGPAGTMILVRNHELLLGNGPYLPGEAPPEAFDPLAMGCVTRVVVDATTYERVSSNLLLCGTLFNCAGGPTPWGWLSCEENVSAGHGYTFLCDPAADRVQPPQPLPALGRFKHEAAAYDPATGAIYLTEDIGDGCLYRFLPDDPAEPFVGRLEALRVKGEDVALTQSMAAGAPPVAIDWVAVDDPDPEGDNVRLQVQAKGAAIFRRGEGIVFAPHGIYIVATSGGPVNKGQIFRLIDSGGPEGTLEVIAESTDPDLLDMPDNITAAPWGELFFCEDGSGTNYLRGLTADGTLFDFARNAKSESELAGVCFSPAGDALFVNLQFDGLTLVITGPFPEVPEPEPEPEPEPGDTDGGETDGDTDGGDTDGTGAGETDSDSDTGDTELGGETAGPGLDSPEGCGCRADGDGGGELLGLGLAVAAAGSLRARSAKNTKTHEELKRAEYEHCADRAPSKSDSERDPA